MSDWEGTSERRKGVILMEGRVSVLESEMKNIRDIVDELKEGLLSTVQGLSAIKESTSNLNNNVPQLNKSIDFLLKRMDNHEVNASKRHVDCERIEFRVDVVEKQHFRFDDRFKDHIRKTIRTAIVGGLIGGMVGKLTPELGGLLVKLLSKLFFG